MRYFTPPLLRAGAIFAAGMPLAVVASLTLSGCPTGGSLEDPDQYHGGGCDIPAILATCAGPICHDPGGSGGVDLISPGVEGRLVGVPATYQNVEVSPETCPTDNPELLIDPNNIDNSLMLTKLLGTQACGYAMPIPNPPRMPDAQINCMRQWAQQLVESGGGTTTGTGGSGMGGAP